MTISKRQEKLEQYYQKYFQRYILPIAKRLDLDLGEIPIHLVKDICNRGNRWTITEMLLQYSKERNFKIILRKPRMIGDPDPE